MGGEREVATVAAAGAERRDALRKPFLRVSRDARQSPVSRGRPAEQGVEVLLHSEQGVRFKILSTRLRPGWFSPRLDADEGFGGTMATLISL